MGYLLVSQCRQFLNFDEGLYPSEGSGVRYLNAVTRHIGMVLIHAPKILARVPGLADLTITP